MRSNLEYDIDTSLGIQGVVWKQFIERGKHEPDQTSYLRDTFSP
jgi:hypothetical protein